MGWRGKLCLMGLGLSVYLMISALISVSNIGSFNPSSHGMNSRGVEATIGVIGDSLMSPVRLGQPRNLAAVVGRGRLSPRRLRSRMGPAIEWCKPQKFRPNPGPRVALASFPGSGNTWLRYLIQQTSGILTGSVYKDYALLKNGFPAENIVNGSVAVVKTHEFGEKNMQAFDKALLLVRDPFSALQAEFNRRSGGHVGHASKEKYRRNNGKYWRTFVANNGIQWERMIEAWVKGFKVEDRLVVFYDDLTNRTEHELRRILEFLDDPISDTVMNCAMSKREGIYKRSKKVLNFEVFDKDMKRMLNERMRRVYQSLGRHVEDLGTDVPDEPSPPVTSTKVPKVYHNWTTPPTIVLSAVVKPKS
eukprot:snap_masked-scaffold274_size229011-processed-gene-1.4 protein:Tk02571 transcript:snap_masked-scaffold274_size229011-processed-gene-1.4-mRNA-1 annotation:"GI15414"